MEYWHFLSQKFNFGDLYAKNARQNFKYFLCKSHYFMFSYKSLLFYVFIRWLVLFYEFCNLNFFWKRKIFRSRKIHDECFLCPNLSDLMSSDIILQTYVFHLVVRTKQEENWSSIIRMNNCFSQQIFYNFCQLIFRNPLYYCFWI